LLLQRDQAAEGAAGARAPLDWHLLATHYQFGVLAPTRVAGRIADVVDIKPRDGLRYGYRFSIDQETALPLQTALLDAEGFSIQQLMFTDVRLIAEDEPAFASPVDAPPTSDTPPTPAAAQGVSRLEAAGLPPLRVPSRQAAAPQDASASAAAGEPPGRNSRWRLATLPAGYALRVHDWIEGEAGAPVEYFLVSDGLASASLYIERSEEPGLIGQTRLAAVNAAGKWHQGHQLTAVGEVPAATVMALIEAAVAAVDPSTLSRETSDARH
jgi:sigma-E factor negative regulatory protein RseB